MGYVLTTDEICVYRPDEPPQDTVKRIKERVEEKEGIPPPQQRLIFGGKQMHDDKSASDYNRESSLLCSLHIKGGREASDMRLNPTSLELEMPLLHLSSLGEAMPFSLYVRALCSIERPSLHLVYLRNEQPHLCG